MSKILDMSFWQIVAWSCCAGPIVLCLVVGLAAVVFEGFASILWGHAPPAPPTPEGKQSYDEDHDC